MPDSFEQATRLTRLSESEHDLLVPDGWQQGRGAFGGLVLGAMLDAMVADEPDASRTPRAFLGEICAPALPVASRLQTRVLRRGRNQSNVTCTFTQDGQVVAHASAVLATARKAQGAPALSTPAPRPGRFEDAAVTPIGPPQGPVFAAHYEYRLTSPPPFSGAGTGEVTGWVRERLPPKKVTPAVLLARLDAYYPALYPMERVPRPIATVSFMAELLADPATLDPSTPLFYRARSLAEAGGYFVELRELWNGEQPVAFNQQSFAILA
jgi:acyl-CoA thioesterase